MVSKREKATSKRFWIFKGMFGLATVAMVYVGYVSATTRPSRTIETRRPVFSGPDDAPPAQLVDLDAGLRFDERQPPKGWNRLILKSTPRLASGDLDTLSEEAIKTADRVRLLMAADVASAPGSERYALKRVGLALSAEAEDGQGDVTVTPRAVGGSKGPWSTKHRIILTAASFELSHAALVAASPTFALVRVPTRYLNGREHQKTSLLYAYLLDPDSGRLRTFAWLETAGQPPKVLNELLTPLQIDGALDVKAGRIAGIPLTWSFAMITVPGETQHEVDPELAAKLASEQLDATAPDELEATIAAVAANPVKPVVSVKQARTPAASKSNTPAP